MSLSSFCHLFLTVYSTQVLSYRLFFHSIVSLPVPEDREEMCKQWESIRGPPSTCHSCARLSSLTHDGDTQSSPICPHHTCMLSSSPLPPSSLGGHQGTVTDLNVHESDGKLTGVDSDIEIVGWNEVTIFFWSSVSGNLRLQRQYLNC